MRISRLATSLYCIPMHAISRRFFSLTGPARHRVVPPRVVPFACGNGLAQSQQVSNP
jgi:hypothetical protein